MRTVVVRVHVSVIDVPVRYLFSSPCFPTCTVTSAMSDLTTSSNTFTNYTMNWLYMTSAEKKWDWNEFQVSKDDPHHRGNPPHSIPRSASLMEPMEASLNTYSYVDANADMFMSLLNETVSATTHLLQDYSSSTTTFPKFTTDGGAAAWASSAPTASPTPELPTISPTSRNFIITYCFLFIIGAVGNLSVFISVGSELWRKYHRSRIKVLILHLSLADLFVILFVIPIEVFWRMTIYWNGGNVLCKICHFFKSFGLYLSSNIIICISLDRFYVIISPLKVIGGMRRVRNMLVLAWLFAIAFAAPQSVIFSVHRHPRYKSVEQCDTLGYFDSLEDEILYNMLSVSAMYFVPLIVILFTYVSVLIKVTRRSREHQNISEYHRRMLQQQHRLGIPSAGGPVPSSDGLMISSRILLKRKFARGSSRLATKVTVSTTTSTGTGGPDGGVICTETDGHANSLIAHRRGSQFLRTSDTANSISRARRKAFFLTMIIITAFVICWTPYVVMTCWYILDWESAKMFDARLKEAFFIMAVSNSCLNPLIYGNYMKRCYYGFCAKERPNTIASDEVRSGGGAGGAQRGESCDLNPL